MKISILIPAHNEEQSIKDCVDSCLNQSRLPDQIVVVDDGSTDKTSAILKSFGNKITVVRIPVATGNKSFAQERGLTHVTGDVFVATDADSILDKQFLEYVEKGFADPSIVAVSGYVKSLKYNWLTACRELDYVVGQDLYKVAQSNINYLFVIPGCAGAFKTSIFKKHIKFDHDTLAEDLDFTYKMHLNYFKIKYEPMAITYTQDPTSLGAYVNQMRRWYRGGWQNLVKHFPKVLKRPASALELSLIYIEGFIFSILMFLFPLISINFFKFFIIPYFFIMFALGAYAAIVRRRTDLLFISPLYVVLVFINAYIFLEQFMAHFVFRRKMLVWFKPERVKLT